MPQCWKSHVAAHLLYVHLPSLISTVVILCNDSKISSSEMTSVVGIPKFVDWLQSLKQYFINLSYHILVASLTLMALFLKQSHQSKTSYMYICHIDEKLF